MSNIVDATGKEIVKGNIVGMSDPNGNWSSYQGLVVEPCSDIEGPEYCTAVFFNMEVSSSEFWHWRSGGMADVSAWDSKYLEPCRKGETSFLLDGEGYKTCPRVIFFKPDELVIQENWKMKALVDRLFPRYYHTYYELKESWPKNPEAYQCWIKECLNPATKLALFNVWGSVYPLFVCDECFPKTNGYCGDDLPEKKKQPLDRNGVLIQV